MSRMKREAARYKAKVQAKVDEAFPLPPLGNPDDDCARGYYALAPVWLGGLSNAPKGTVFAVENVTRSRSSLLGPTTWFTLVGVTPDGSYVSGIAAGASFNAVPLPALRDRETDGAGGIWWAEIKARIVKLAQHIGWPAAAILAPRFSDVSVYDPCAAISGRTVR